MAPISWADVSAHAPELSGVDLTVQADLILWANTAWNPAEFGGEDHITYRLLRIYSVAHFATIGPTSGGQASTAEVSSESAGGLSRSYSLTTDSSTFSGSSYGEWVKDLIRKSPARAPLII